jgi:uncharacterized protein (TIGR02647 family)
MFNNMVVQWSKISMKITPQLIDKMDLLLQFELESTQTGIKIHHTARTGLIEAAKSLHEEGLISQPDGGYLTDLGYEAVEHLRHAIQIMDAECVPAT